MIEYHTQLNEEDAMGISANIPLLEMPPDNSQNKGSPKILSPIRSQTFVNQLSSEESPPSLSKSRTSRNTQQQPQDTFNRATTFINPEWVPQSPVRSLTSLELQKISRRGSNTSAFKPQTSQYTVIPSVAEGPEQLIPCKSGPQESPVAPLSAMAFSRKRMTPLQTPLSGPIRTDKPAFPTPVEVNGTIESSQLNNVDTTGSPPTRKVSVGQSTTACPARVGEQSVSQGNITNSTCEAWHQLSQMPETTQDVPGERLNLIEAEAQINANENDINCK